MPKLTVIMPAYNAENYIEASVESVLSQTFSDLRLIVVDDGSTDSTPERLRRIAARDGRVELLTVPNGGPAMARNRALELVDGSTDYLLFADADDRLAPDAVEYALAGSRDADMVIFGFSIVSPDGSERHYFESERHLTEDGIGEALPALYKANLLNQVWGKLFRANLVLDNGIAFQDYRWGEDRLFIYDCLEKTSTLSVLPECKYRYIMHPGESLITRFYDKKLRVCLEADDRIETLCARFGVSDERVFRYMFSKSVFSCLTTLFSPGCPLSHSEKRAYVSAVVKNGRVHRRCRDTFGGLPANALCAVVRSGNVTLNMLTFRLVAFVGRVSPKLFMALKHRK